MKGNGINLLVLRYIFLVNSEYEIVALTAHWSD